MSWAFVSRLPDMRLRPYVIDYQGYREHSRAPMRRLQAPFASIPMIVTFGPSIDVINGDRPAERANHRSFLAGQQQFVVPGENDTIAHAQLHLGPGMIMMGSGGKPEPGNPWTTERCGTYFVVPDIDAHYARAKAAGAKIERPLADTEYGSREYSARDCDGHLWSFGTYDPYAES